MPRLTVKLTPEQRTELEHARDHDRRPYFRERCAAVLKVAEGQPCYQVGEQGLLRHRNKDTVAAWVKAYRTEGLAALQQQPRGHRGYSPRTGRATPTGR